MKDLSRNCKNLRMGGGKGSLEMVVTCFCSRGAAIPTRLERLVVRPPRSCLGLIDKLGMNNRRVGSRNRGKGVK